MFEEGELGLEAEPLLNEGKFETVESTSPEALKRQIYDNLRGTGLSVPIIKTGPDGATSKYLYDGKVPPAVAFEVWANHALSVYENPPGENEEEKALKKAEAAKTFIGLVELLLKRADEGVLDEELTGTAFNLGEYSELMPELKEYIRWRAERGDREKKERKGIERPEESKGDTSREESKAPERKVERRKEGLSPREQVIDSADYVVEKLRHPGVTEQSRAEAIEGLRSALEGLVDDYIRHGDAAAKAVIHEIANRAKGLKENRFKIAALSMISIFQRKIENIAREARREEKEVRREEAIDRELEEKDKAE